MSPNKDDICIAHLSDLHLSNQAAKDVFKSVAKDVREFAPRLILVTGDLVDTPNESQLKEAKTLLNELASSCGASLQVVPGNHDLRIKGLIHKKSYRDVFDTTFTNWNVFQHYPLPGRNISVFCCDSNSEDEPLINLARGKVGIPEYVRLGEEVARLKSAHGKGFDDSYKIVLLHHHPLPIPDTEIDKTLYERYQEAGLALDDAGSFLREVVANGVDLVLHGHKHCPAFARLRLTTKEKGENEIVILGAGSASNAKDPGPHGNAYNILTFKADGSIHAHQRHMVGGTFYVLRETTLLNYDQVLERAYHHAIKLRGSFFKSVTHETFVNDFGDSTNKIRYGHYQVLNSTIKAIPVQLEVWPGGKCIAGPVTSKTGKVVSPKIVQCEKNTDQRFRGAIKFDMPVSKATGPISFDFEYTVFNAFALSQDQHLRMYGNKEHEHRSVYIRHPYERQRYSLILTQRSESQILA